MQMKTIQFIKNSLKGIVFVIIGGVIFCLTEYSIYLLGGSNFNIDTFLQSLYVYAYVSIFLALTLTLALLILYKFRQKWIDKLNIKSFFSAFFIFFISYFYIKFYGLFPFIISKLFLTPTSLSEDIIINIGTIALSSLLLIALYTWLKYFDKKNLLLPFYAALTCSASVLIIGGIYLNNLYDTFSHIKTFILINAILLAGSLLLFGFIFLLSQFALATIKGHTFSVKKKIVFIFSLFVFLGAVTLFIKISYDKPDAKSIEDYAKTNKNKPNIILITIDTLRADSLSCYGNNLIKTSNIDSLAVDGILFEKAISQSPWTTPSVASILTGLYPSTHKAGEIIWNGSEKRWGRIIPSIPTMAKILSENGYLTSAIVTNLWLDKKFGFADGFTYFENLDLEPNTEARTLSLFCFKFYKERKYSSFYTPANIVTNKANRFLENHGKNQIFLWIHYIDPHDSYSPPEKYKKNLNYQGKLLNEDLKNSIDRIKAGALNLNLEDKNYLKLLYNAEIKFVDDEIGKLIQKLKDLDILDSSIIILTSDHGEEFWEHGFVQHGHTLFNELLHVPLIFNFNEKSGLNKKIIKEQVRLIDIFPTILDILKINYKGPAHGDNLMPLILGTNCYDRALISEYMHYYEEKKALIDNSYKYIYFTESQKRELYNLQNDSAELKDIHKQLPEITSSMHNQLMKLLEDSERLSKTLSKNEKIKPPELSQEFRQKLKALGYIN